MFKTSGCLPTTWARTRLLRLAIAAAFSSSVVTPCYRCGVSFEWETPLVVGLTRRRSLSKPRPFGVPRAGTKTFWSNENRRHHVPCHLLVLTPAR